MSAEALLRVDGLKKYFPVTAGVMGRVVAQVKAVDGVSFDLEAGRTLGLVGESGCGKTTVGQTLLRLLEPTAGRVFFEGDDIAKLPAGELRLRRRDMQIIFQDPFNSLNPRMTVADIVGEAMRVHGMAGRDDVEQKVGEILERVGIPAAWMNRYPHEFSGGQRQRISIARAIALEPKLVVCDEAVSALDVSIQAQVINLLIRLREEMGLSYLFISHDLSVVKHISDRIAVMYLGRIVESAPTDELFAAPVHPYTRALLSAIPIANPGRRPDRIVLQGDVPTPLDPPSGCHFHTRCPAVMARCRREAPPMVDLPGEHKARCFLAVEEAGMGPSSSAEWYEGVLARSRAAEQEHEATPEARAAHAAAVARAGVASGGPVDRIEVEHEVANRIGMAMIAFGAVAMLAGAPVLGAAIAAVSYRALLHSAVPGRLRARAVAGLVVGIAACGYLGAWIESSARVREAERQLAELGSVLEQTAAIRGRYPESLRELGWRLPPIVGAASAIDPWGRPWRYRAPDAVDERPWLGSLGPDGAPGGGDDVGRLPDVPG